MSGLNQRIDVLCSDQQHPIQARLRTWCEQQDARLCGQVDELLGGDFLFLVSCQSIVSTQLRARYRYCLVVHASDLPTWARHVPSGVAGDQWCQATSP